MHLENRDKLTLNKPMVIARRWDGIGGRLNAIVNAMSVACALDSAFRFIWPLGPDLRLNDPKQLFNEKFLRDFQITEDKLAGKTIKLSFQPAAMTALQAKAQALLESDVPILDIAECYFVQTFAGEDITTSQRRYVKCFKSINWSPRVTEIVEFFSNWHNAEDCSAIHYRAGDIVTGDWKNFLAHEKYTPTPFIFIAVETLTGLEHKPVLVISDNEPYVKILKQHYAAIRTPRDIYPLYDKLTDVQRALADMLMLSRCRRIVGPPYSAFSRFAANIGGVAFTRLDSMLPAGQEEAVLSPRIKPGLQNLDRGQYLRPLLARDICWYLDVLGDTIPSAEHLSLARQAVELEPKFPGAICRLARAAARAGNHGEAFAAASQARQISELIQRHADPLVESLSTCITIGCLAISTRLRARKFSRKHRLVYLIKRLFNLANQQQNEISVDQLRRLLAKCEKKAPYQMDYYGILMNLRFQIAAIEWLIDHNDLPVLRGSSAILKNAPVFPDFHRSGLECQRANRLFDPVLRYLEQVSIWLCRDIGESIDYSKSNDVPLDKELIDQGFISASGLHWISGVVRDQHVRSVHVHKNGDTGTTYGGPVFLPPTDFWGKNIYPLTDISRFAFPVPPHIRDGVAKGTLKLITLTDSANCRIGKTYKR